MSYKIKVEEGAELDIKDAVNYYKEIASKKVAKQFRTDFKNRIKAIQINPYYRVYANSYRGLPLKNFPYIIFFQIDETEKVITIYSLFETHQDPAKM